jgi:pteridine reductase
MTMADIGRRPVALVTGSGRRRVGRHVAEALAGRGFAIALHYRTAEGEAREFVDHWARLGVEAVALRADLAIEAEARGLVRGAIGRFGRLDVLVNCAAIWEPKPLEQVAADDVRRHFEANVLGTFVCAQEAGLAMVGQVEGGCIVNFGDWAESRPYVGYPAYFATKGAIPTLTRCLAVELGTRNPRVRVNAVLPGPAMLPATLPEAERAEAIRGTLVGREGRPEDLTSAVVFLIENDFITGTCLTVDGGRSVYAAS